MDTRLLEAFQGFSKPCSALKSPERLLNACRGPLTIDGCSEVPTPEWFARLYAWSRAASFPRRGDTSEERPGERCRSTLTRGAVGRWGDRLRGCSFIAENQRQHLALHDQKKLLPYATMR
jgi:hypothetical protein